jgi:hypothetical protein
MSSLAYLLDRLGCNQTGCYSNHRYCHACSYLWLTGKGSHNYGQTPALTSVTQAIIFILKREFMLVGWMVVYLLSYVPSL